MQRRERAQERLEEYKKKCVGVKEDKKESVKVKEYKKKCRKMLLYKEKCVEVTKGCGEKKG